MNPRISESVIQLEICLEAEDEGKCPRVTPLKRRARPTARRAIEPTTRFELGANEPTRKRISRTISESRKQMLRLLETMEANQIRWATSSYT